MRRRRTLGIVSLVAFAAGALVACTSPANDDADGSAAPPVEVPGSDHLPEALPGAWLRGAVTDSIPPEGIGISDGDLWPTCWSDDGEVYAANGDGAGFTGRFSDIVMNRISGEPGDLDGVTLASGDDLGQVWSGEDFTRKPTGMLCVDGTIYLAVQDLALNFDEAPAATIARSDDRGETWTWDTAAPMFADGVFTTIWFADYGQDGEHAPEPGYAYAYGLDGNWRASYTHAVPDPNELFLARVPTDSVQDASTWEFYAGEPGDAEPTWTPDIAGKQPVLVVGDAWPGSLSQGGVTYLPELDRYVYTSWTEWTFDFFEAPEPWGPWTLFLSEDFGAYPWTEERFGGYGTTVPSKFLSEDNRTMWVQSNVCPCAPAGMSSYWFGLRPLEIAPVDQ